MSNGMELLKCASEVSPIVSTTEVKIKATIYEVGGTAPTTIIRTDQDWYALVEWEISGHLVHHLCGEWLVAVNLESIGPGGEYQFPQPADRVKMDPCGDGKYKYKINVKAGQVKADADGTQYIVGVTLGSKDPCDKPGHIFANCKGDTPLTFCPAPPHGP